MEHQIETQLSVEIANEPGEMARVSDLLASSGIHINALSITESEDNGRFIPDDSKRAIAALSDSGFEVTQERVLSVRLSDRKGRLAAITSAFAQAGININYVYASVDQAGASTRLVFSVINIPLATQVLREIKDTPESNRLMELV